MTRRPLGRTFAHMSSSGFIRARDRIIEADRAEFTVNATLTELLLSLHDVAEFQWAALMLTDTETMLPFGGVVEGLATNACVPFWDNELLDPDFSKFNALARSSDPVATLADATDGDLSRSPRFQKLYKPLGGGDELRVAFTTGSTCWAVASLVRRADTGHFSPTEVQSVRDLVPVGSRAVRHAVTRRDTSDANEPPVMLVISAEGEIESMTPGADGVIADFTIHGLDMNTPTPVLAAARRAKSNRTHARITVRARGESGRWFKLHASPLGDDGRVAVMIEAARPADLVPILLESYGLTQRESDVVLLLARGLSTKEIAAELSISRHTVSDHTKLIFTKCAVTSRGELVANLFSQHIIEGMHTAVDHV
jgi:DNA-binding CsgD family transcriptional regulator